ncbi:MAG TPA: HAMP domain-containing sensor histidine kinase [Thermoanaerobaculia bacterium]|nr:HAMP domain-containing sensor histidine kinase [Thermoanaerobaculia bacterium]
MSDRDRAYLQTPEQWTRFLSALTHEMRTPLASLRMLAELLAGAPQGHLGDQEKRYAENIQEVVRDLQGLVGDAAEFSQLLGGRAQVRAEEVSLRLLVDQAEELVRPQAWERGIALTDSMDPALPKHFRTDLDRLRRILVLALGAAVSHAGSEVFFRLDLEEGNLRVLISSDGELFPDSDSQDAFEPFHDGLRAARRRGGRSLALPLANELARALGGTLRAVNRGGRPTLELTLPAGA